MRGASVERALVLDAHAADDARFRAQLDVAGQRILELERTVRDTQALLVDERELVGQALAERDDVALDAGRAAAAPALAAGTVVGKITASGKYVAYADGNADGSQTAAGVLYGNAADSAADQMVTIIARDAEVARNALTGLDANGEADLKALSIIVRD